MSVDRNVKVILNVEGIPIIMVVPVAIFIQFLNVQTTVWKEMLEMLGK